MPGRRTLLLMLAGLAVAAVGFVGWQVWQVQRDLSEARASVAALQASLTDGDTTAQEAAVADLKAAAGSARRRTDGPLWGALTHVPFLGDDARGVEVISRSLDTVAGGGIDPLVASARRLRSVTDGDGLDVEVLRDLQGPVSAADASFTRAADDVDRLDSSGFVGPLATSYDSYARQLDAAADAVGSADTALRVLPDMVGADGPRDYLLIFQNNAEIRESGGIAGSWAQLHADDGSLELVRQGAAGDVPVPRRPVLPLNGVEQQLFGGAIGTYFQDPGLTPDFPRAAAFWDAHWSRAVPDVELDGVVAIDPVALSYLLEGTGPVAVDGATLTSENVVDVLLNQTYLRLGPAGQDRFFRDAAGAVFRAATGRLASPTALVRGIGRAVKEDRLRVAPFDRRDAAALAGTRVLGAFSSGEGDAPRVDVGLDDVTQSKMSYYLRFATDVDATSCDGGRQQLGGRMTLEATIDGGAAARLPASVTGKPGGLGIRHGQQVVAVRVYGPAGGTIRGLAIDGKPVPPGYPVRVGRRPVVTVQVLVTGRDPHVLTWSMTSGPGQTGDGVVDVTPGVVPGSEDSVVPSACTD